MEGKKTVKCIYLYLLNNSKEMLTSKFRFYLFNLLLYQFSWIYLSLIEHYTTLGNSDIKDGCLKLDKLFVLCWFWNYTLTIIKCFIYYISCWVCVSFRFFLLAAASDIKFYTSLYNNEIYNATKHIYTKLLQLDYFKKK